MAADRLLSGRGSSLLWASHSSLQGLASATAPPMDRAQLLFWKMKERIINN